MSDLIEIDVELLSEDAFAELCETEELIFEFVGEEDEE